ncbi:MAG TPA: DUF177 domain-containing protein, partial [Deinococcales bacterium]|nr:DUF177 domain-containing protein [Deinococcales bacterium]
HPGAEPTIEPIPLAGPAHWRATVTHVGADEFWMSGRVTGQAILECSRCLEPVTVDVNASLATLMRHDARANAPHVEYGDDDQEVLVFGEPLLDLTPVLSEAFALQLPEIVLHDPNCKGLCAVCGANLNHLAPETCAVGREDCPHRPGHAEEAHGSPFSALKGLIKE